MSACTKDDDCSDFGTCNSGRCLCTLGRVGKFCEKELTEADLLKEDTFEQVDIIGPSTASGHRSSSQYLRFINSNGVRNIKIVGQKIGGDCSGVRFFHRVRCTLQASTNDCTEPKISPTSTLPDSGTYITQTSMNRGYFTFDSRTYRNRCSCNGDPTAASEVCCQSSFFYLLILSLFDLLLFSL